MGAWTVRDPQRLTIDEPVTRLSVDLVAGKLNVVGTDGPVRIEVSDIGTRPVIVECDRGTLVIRQEKRGFSWITWALGRRHRADVTIAVPHHTQAELRLIEGSVVASGLLAGANIELTAGRVTMLGLDGDVRAKLVSGPVEALGVAGTLVMETMSGELTLADSSATRVHATAISGSITCDLGNPEASAINLRTTSGGVTVRVPADSDLSVDMHTTSGRITSGFGELPEVKGGYGLNTLRGTLGKGTGTLSVSSMSGNLALLAGPVHDQEES